jgi:F0F1-type ATP synthase assembly protein I
MNDETYKKDENDEIDKADENDEDYAETEMREIREEIKNQMKRAEKAYKKHKKKNEKFNIAKAFALITQLGIQMACCVAIGVVAGIFIDRFFGTAPLFIIIFSIIGSSASLKLLYDIAKNWKD